MSWVNDKPNQARDYLNITELLSRPIQLGPMPGRDIYHGRSATVLEEALDSAFFNAFKNLGIIWTKNPNTCPASMLPALAVETGVSGWYQGSSETMQRNTIATSKEIHRKAGTITGISQAISTLGIDVTITNSKIPYRLTVLSDTALTPELTDLVSDRISRYKSERDEIYIEKVVPSSSKVFYGTATLMSVGYYSRS